MDEWVMLEFAKRYRSFLVRFRDALQEISRAQDFFLYVSSLPVVAARLSACTEGLFLLVSYGDVATVGRSRFAR